MDSENGKKALTESELIDRQVEEIMTDEESAEGGKRKKKRRKKARSGEKPSLKERWKGYSRKRKIITVVVVLAAAAFLLSRCGGGGEGAGGRTCERHVPDAPAHQGEAVGQRPCFRYGQRGRGVQYPRGDHYHECEGGRQGH